MAELTQTELETKIADLDTAIAAATSAMAAGAGGQGAVVFLDHSIGEKSVSGSQHLAQLMEARKMYHELLQQMPKEIVRDQQYSIGLDGDDNSEYQGDE